MSVCLSTRLVSNSRTSHRHLPASDSLALSLQKCVTAPGAKNCLLNSPSWCLLPTCCISRRELRSFYYHSRLTTRLLLASFTAETKSTWPLQIPPKRPVVLIATFGGRTSTILKFHVGRASVWEQESCNIVEADRKVGFLATL